MLDHANAAYNAKVLDQVKDPARRAQLASVLEDADRMLREKVLAEARARDAARAEKPKRKRRRLRGDIGGA